ncbi:MAG: LysR family transcriptional regulator [Clostridiaceae bacterium]|nr:LysR family transcriptional regulator [Clostridiaceae bacterium]
MSNDLELYRVFYTVAKCGNISQAAEQLYISQPAVSKTIRRLETIVGITLFLRSSRGVKLTNEGDIFFEYVERAIKEISVGEEILSKLKKREHGIIKLGVSTTLCKYYLIPRLKQFISKYPDIQIKIINKTTFETIKLVEEGIIDFGLVSIPFNAGSYNYIELANLQDTFVASKEYLQPFGIIKPNEVFSKCSFMLLESDNIARKYIDQYFMNNNILVKPEIEVSNMDLLIEFAKIGLGVTVVIKDFINKELSEGSLTEILVTPQISKRTIGIISHKKVPLSIAAQTFLSFIEEKIGEY